MARLYAVPTTRKVNGKALSSDISLSATDVGAVPTGRTVNGKALTGNISLSAGDVGAAAASHSHNYAGSNGAGGTANSCNNLTFAIAATNPGGAVNNKVYFVY